MKASIIIRTKNEERWITPCISAIKKQTYKNFEIIIVDNCSTDKTVEKAKKLGVKKIINIKNYLPGKSLNLGFENSKGEYVVCISAHCIPKNKKWLESLIYPLDQNKLLAGAYGRQEPMNFSSNSDKRDLFLVFGLDRRIQIRDSFFHNANSIIRRLVWNKIKFDEKTTNIEDRIWAKKVMSLGWQILYEPKASVFHYHGIHQDGNKERLKNVVNIIQKERLDFKEGKISPKDLKIIAIIPSKGSVKYLDKKALISLTIKSALKSKFIDRVYVSTDNQETKKISIRSGAYCPFLRPKSLSKPKISLEKVQQYSLKKIEKYSPYIPDLIVHLEETFPYRKKSFIDEMIQVHLDMGYDSLIAAKEESGIMWRETEKNVYDRIDEGYIPRRFKKNIYIGLHGLCCVTFPNYIRKGKMLGKNIGLFKVADQISTIEVRDQSNLEKISNIKKLFKD